MSVARERIVRSLQGLYTVVVGLALTKSIERLFEGSTPSQVEFHAHHLPGLIAFIATLIPFYHGALRHLDKRYIEEHGVGLKNGALAADFALLFVEGCFLAAMAYLVATPSKLMNASVLLFGIDAAWCAGIYLVFVKGRREWAELEWVWLNIWTVGLLLVLQWWQYIGNASQPTTIHDVAFPAIMVARTCIDYARSWKFYFP